MPLRTSEKTDEAEEVNSAGENTKGRFLVQKPAPLRTTGGCEGLIGERTRDRYNMPFVDNTFPANRSSRPVA